ncbi:serine hydrolase domain-containing protein [Alteromonas facilis]|uniref:serine hydrolase domain-containing protein n=1 Tax=Alteromonas facilis TaxID=2048004 RepID=UPI0013D960B5|nr:serine hydrolase domain-containing protein [Alteromonas facilis]
MRFVYIGFLFWLFSPFALSKGISKQTETKLNEHIQRAQKRYGIIGQSVAILKHGELVYLHAAGNASIEFNVPVTPDTIFSIYSVTKLFVSTRLLQLAETGALDLSDTLGKHFPDMPKQWRSVSVLQALSHMSGIPEYSQDMMTHLSGEEAIAHVADEPMAFISGTQSRYNQTNFYYIQKLVEKFDQRSLEDSITENAILPYKLVSTHFGGEFDVINGRATRYEGAASGIKRVMRNDPPAYYLGANGMNSSASDLARWFSALLNGGFLRQATLEKAWAPLSLKNGRKARHSHGWEVSEMNGYSVVGHHGANTVNVRHFFKDDIKEGAVTVIHLTNGILRRFSLVDFSYTLASEIVEEMQTPLRALKENMLVALESGEWETAKAHYAHFKANYAEQLAGTELMLNTLGYMVMEYLGAEQALPVFSLNVQEYPDSSNALDSLAEAYLNSGDKNKAKYYYAEALKIDKDNERIKHTLRQLEEVTKPTHSKTPAS